MGITLKDLHLIIAALDAYHDVLVERLTKEGHTLDYIEKEIKPIETLILKIVLQVQSSGT